MGDKNRIIIVVPNPDTLPEETVIVFNEQEIPINLRKNKISRITVNINAGEIPKLEIEYLGYISPIGASDAE